MTALMDEERASVPSSSHWNFFDARTLLPYFAATILLSLTEFIAIRCATTTSSYRKKLRSEPLRHFDQLPQSRSNSLSSTSSSSSTG